MCAWHRANYEELLPMVFRHSCLKRRLAVALVGTDTRPPGYDTYHLAIWMTAVCGYLLARALILPSVGPFPLVLCILDPATRDLV